jgi:hypothetical protein
VAPVSINNFSATPAEDGSVTIVVAEQDPGLPNWIATLGCMSSKVLGPQGLFS